MNLQRSLPPAAARPPIAGWLVVLALAATLAAPAHAQWKWRDANGRITASDLPPPREVPEKDILQRPVVTTRTPPAAPASAAASSVPPVAKAPAGDKDLEARKKAADQQAQAKAKAEEDKNAAIRAENCRRARSHLATLDSGQRMFRVNDKGEREIIDDRARAQETQRAREVIASDCK